MIALSTLRARWAGFAGTFVALSLGVALLGATGLQIAAAVARPSSPQLYAAATAMVTADRTVTAREGSGDEETTATEQAPEPRRLPVAVVAAVAAVPGVARAVPERTFYAQLVAPRDAGAPAGAVVSDPRTPVGRSWSAAALTPYTLEAGVAPTAPGDVVVERSLAATAHVRPGDDVGVSTDAGVRRFRVTGLARTDRTPAQAPLFFSDATAAALSTGAGRPGGVDAVGVLAGPGLDLGALAERLRHLPAGLPSDIVVVSGDARHDLEPDPDAEALVGVTSLLGTTSGLAGFISVFVVSGTFAFAVSQRRREFALLRSIGATPRQIRRMVAAEALLVGVFAALAGCALALPAARVAAGRLVAAGFAPATFTVGFSLVPLLSAAGVGIAVALLGSYAAGRRAGKVRPAEALREASVESRVMTKGRGVWAVLFLAGTTASVVLGPRAGPEASLGFSVLDLQLAVITAGLLAPVVVPVVVRVLTAPLARSRGAVPLLARQSALTSVRRTASTAAPVLVTVALAVGLLALTATVNGAESAFVARRTTADSVVLPQGAPGIPPAAVDALAATPGARAAGVLTIRVLRPEGPAVTDDFADGVDPAALQQVISMPVRQGSLAALTGTTVAVSTGEGSRVGDVVPLWLPDGTAVRPRVVAVVDAPPNLSPLLLPQDLVRAHTRTPLAGLVLTRGGDPGELARRAGPGSALTSVLAWRAGQDAAQEHTNGIALAALLGMALLYTGIAVANTLVMSTGERGREFAVLRLGGATTRQVLGMVALEAGLVVAVGVTLGAAVTALCLAGVVAAVSALVGAAAPVVVPWSTALLVAVACLALGVLAAVLPAAAGARRAVEIAGARE